MKITYIMDDELKDLYLKFITGVCEIEYYKNRNTKPQKLVNLHVEQLRNQQIFNSKLYDKYPDIINKKVRIENSTLIIVEDEITTGFSK